MLDRISDGNRLTIGEGLETTLAARHKRQVTVIRATRTTVARIWHEQGEACRSP